MPQPKKPRSTPARKAAPAADPPPEVRITALRERLFSSLTLPADRLNDTLDDAVRRGRMTRKDAEELLQTLVSTGRAQTEALLADLEQLLGLGGAMGARAAGTSDAVLRTVDKARRAVRAPGFPILNYDELTAQQVSRRLKDLTPAQLRKVRDHERRHANRKSVMAAIDKRLA